FDWERIWLSYIESTKASLERAKAHDLKFSIEHHTHCVIPDATSFLRLWDAIKNPALGYNLDSGWTLLQREYPPLAIHKVKNHLMNLHVRDIDPHMRSFPHIGLGVMEKTQRHSGIRQQKNPLWHYQSQLDTRELLANIDGLYYSAISHFFLISVQY
ncbi:unnamed protein product, partial [marine sediment metagenome]